MAYLIGTTSFLQPLVCQNDIWLTAGNPNEPTEHDVRIITQTVNALTAFIYIEIWLPHERSWAVVPMNPEIRAEMEFPPGPPIAMPQQQLPLELLTNPRRIDNNHAITGFWMTWGITLRLYRLNNQPVFYIPHAPRRPGHLYLPPPEERDEEPIIRRQARWLRWALQISHYRRAQPWW